MKTLSVTYIGIAIFTILIIGLSVGYRYWPKSDTSTKSMSPSSKRTSPPSDVKDQPKFLGGTQLKKFIQDDMGYPNRIRIIGPNTTITKDHDSTRVNIMTKDDDPSSAVVDLDMF